MHLHIIVQWARTYWHSVTILSLSLFGQSLQRHKPPDVLATLRARHHRSSPDLAGIVKMTDKSGCTVLQNNRGPIGSSCCAPSRERILYVAKKRKGAWLYADIFLRGGKTYGLFAVPKICLTFGIGDGVKRPGALTFRLVNGATGHSCHAHFLLPIFSFLRPFVLDFRVSHGTDRQTDRRTDDGRQRLMPPRHEGGGIISDWMSKLIFFTEDCCNV